jgi:hypothetical protein
MGIFSLTAIIMLVNPSVTPQVLARKDNHSIVVSDRQLRESTGVTSARSGLKAELALIYFADLNY